MLNASETREMAERRQLALASSNAFAPTTLRPASVDQFNLELLACLTLVAPVGMNEDLRIEWLKVARATIGDLPSDLLAIGCENARKHADHPAKIVPKIMEAVEPMLRRRRELAEPRIPEARRISQSYVTAEEAAKILRDNGLGDVAAKAFGEAPQGIEARQGGNGSAGAVHESQFGAADAPEHPQVIGNIAHPLPQSETSI